MVLTHSVQYVYSSPSGARRFRLHSDLSIRSTLGKYYDVSSHCYSRLIIPWVTPIFHKYRKLASARNLLGLYNLVTSR